MNIGHNVDYFKSVHAVYVSDCTVVPKNHQLGKLDDTFIPSNDKTPTPGDCEHLFVSQFGGWINYCRFRKSDYEELKPKVRGVIQHIIDTNQVERCWLDIKNLHDFLTNDMLMILMNYSDERKMTYETNLLISGGKFNIAAVTQYAENQEKVSDRFLDWIST